MKHLIKQYLATSLLLISSACTLIAAPFSFTNGDLIIGFQASGGTGSTKNLFFDLGSGVALRDNPSAGAIGNIGATLSSVFGPDWYDRTDLYCGVIGNLNFGPNSGLGSQSPVNGDPSRTVYVSTAAASPGQGGLIPAATYSPSNLGIAGNNLSGTEGILTGLTAEADGSAILDQTTSAVEWNNGWTNWNPTSQPATSYGIFSGGIQQNFGKAGTKTYLDVQRVLAYSTGANPAGVVGGGVYATTIAISSAGIVSAQNATPPAQPLIMVQQPAGTNLPAGSASTDFGSVNVGSNKNLSFTITNTGNADLTDLTITKDGANVSDFTVTANPVAPVAGSGTTTFTVRFTPSAGGSRAAAIHIASNDPNNNPFDITLTGTGTAPDIVVQQPVGTNLPDPGSRDFGNILVSSDASLVFTIKNNGNADLTGLAITKDGVNASDFTVTANPVAPVAGGDMTTFTVKFAPAATGPRTAAIHIASNDANENPFDITLTGTGLAPEIAVQQPVGTDISSKTFGNVVVGSGKNITFTIKNSGNADLTGLAISKDGANASDFTVTANPVAPVAGGGSTTFTVKFAPAVAGPRTAAIHIASNDANENPFNITLTGTGLAPEIAVQQPEGTNINDNGSKGFGNVVVGSDKSLTFTIKNSGRADLTGLAITKDGANASDFTVTASPVAPVTAGESTTFTVRFAPTVAGPKTAAIHIASNDANENPFDINLTGAGLAPEIAVQLPVGTNINDNGSKGFGNVVVGSDTSLTFTIKNSGRADLTGLAITTDGVNASDFTVTANPVAPVAGGGSTTFTVRFAPTVAGPKTAAIHIASNDANENPFDIKLTGAGLAPEIAVQLTVGTNINNNGSKGFGNVVVGSDKSLTFTIKNSGRADLTGLVITKNGANASDFTVTANPVAPVTAGGSTSFTVRFAPATLGAKTAAIHIASNDPNKNPFNITLKGSCIKASSPSAPSSNNAAPLGGTLVSEVNGVPGDTSKTVITVNPGDGRKYLTLLVTKAAGTMTERRVVEVSSDLMNWYSGKNYTTILQNNSSMLKVRDNTPLTLGTKRYIRLKTPSR